MLSLKKKARHCISFLNHKIKGGAGIFVIMMIAVLFLLTFFKIWMDRERVYITYYSVDDSMVSSLLAASTVNMYEFGRSGQLIIYENLPALMDEEMETNTDYENAVTYLSDSALLYPSLNSCLSQSLQRFKESIRVNMGLDNEMNANMSGIDGSVSLLDFSVYNKFEYFDEDGNLIAYRFVRYYHDGTTWRVVPYDINEEVSVYSSFDKTNIPLTATTVVANLGFRIKVFDGFTWLGIPGVTKDVSYQRLVDVSKY